MPILVRDERANGASARTAAGRPTSAPAVRRASAASYIGSRVGGDSPSKELKSSPSVETLASTRVLSSRTSLLSTPRDRSQPRSSPRSTATTIVKSPPSSNRRVSTARDSRRSASAARPKSARPPSSARAHTPSHDQNVHAGPAAKDRVVVAVRKRPAKEGEKDVVIVQDGRVLKVAEPRTKVDLTKYIEFHKFEFHEAFDDNCSNEFIYHSQVQPVVDFVVKGGHGTCFAFGQTGSGKTFTMLGGQSSPGLMTLGAEELLERWSADAAGSAADKPQLAAVELAANMRQHVSVSMLEIYGDEVYDLLHPHARAKLIPREDASRKVRIQGLTRKLVSTPEEFRKQVDLGAARRCTATTGVNESSSRSHAICELTLHLPVAGGVAAEEVGREWGKCRFVDLAGSEKGADSADQDRVTRSEGAEINKSLLALKECIRAMHDPSSTFTPFRGSKLTLVLRDSFLGQGRILMVANVSPDAAHCGETVNSLRYAHRVTQIGRPLEQQQKRQQQQGIESGEGRRATATPPPLDGKASAALAASGLARRRAIAQPPVLKHALAHDAGERDGEGQRRPLQGVAQGQDGGELFVNVEALPLGSPPPPPPPQQQQQQGQQQCSPSAAAIASLASSSSSSSSKVARAPRRMVNVAESTQESSLEAGSEGMWGGGSVSPQYASMSSGETGEVARSVKTRRNASASLETSVSSPGLLGRARGVVGRRGGVGGVDKGMRKQGEAERLEGARGGIVEGLEEEAEEVGGRGGCRLGPTTELVRLFRAGVEESMFLVEQEVAFLDALEAARTLEAAQPASAAAAMHKQQRGGLRDVSGEVVSKAQEEDGNDWHAVPLTEDKVECMHSLLQQRIFNATALQAALDKYTAHKKQHQALEAREIRELFMA